MKCERCGHIEGKEKPNWLFYIYHHKTKIAETKETITFMKGATDLLCGSCCDFIQGTNRQNN